jgi:hypothetical protein
MTMGPVKATSCELREEGLYLTFNDGATFFYPQAFLFSTRFTHAEREMYQTFPSGEVKPEKMDRSDRNPDRNYRSWDTEPDSIS